MPLYNKSAHLKHTLESIRIQHFSDYELIIVDDASTDDSLGVIRTYLHHHRDLAGRVRIVQQAHAGVSAARNRGIRESRFEWIAFLDADDHWSPEYLKAQYALSLKYPFCEVLGAAYGFDKGRGIHLPGKFHRLSFAGQDGVIDNYFEVASSSHPPLSSITTIVRKYAIEAIGGFPEGVSSGEDLLTWARLAINSRIAFNRRQLAIFNQDVSLFNDDQRDRKPAVSDTVGQCLETLLRRYPGIPGLKRYVGLWHKMRTRIFLDNAMKKEAWKEWKKMLRFDPGHFKTWAYLLPLVSPIKFNL